MSSSSSSSSAVPELITSGEIDAIYTPISSTRLDTIINKVTKNASILRRKSHVIQTSEFDTVYFSSDIHADFRKYVQMLQAINLAGMTAPIVEPYPADTIYDPRIIGDVTWTGGSRVLLVIIGDLVDGRRDHAGINHDVNDPRGSFEFLLCSYLYNLRIKAREAGSEILYTIGNHDYHTVISDDARLYDGFDMNEYIHPTAITFFNNSKENRRRALRSFYLANPYFMLSFMNDSKKEMACIHGGFHNTDDNYTNDIEIFQTTIDSITDSTKILSKLAEKEKNPIFDNSVGKDGGLWTRYYSGTTEGICNNIDPSDYPFIVVGHCPTTQSNRPLQLMFEGKNDKYKGCSISDGMFRNEPTAFTKIGNKFQETGVGCVVTDCDKEGHGPRLAFVDTALSEAFRFPTRDRMIQKDNTDRYAQFLRLTHVDFPIKRYYNKIESVTTNPSNTTVVLYEPSQYTKITTKNGTVYKNFQGRTTKETPLHLPPGWTSLITMNGIEYRKNGVRKYTAEAERAALALTKPSVPKYNSRKRLRTKRSNRTHRRRSRRA